MKKSISRIQTVPSNPPFEIGRQLIIYMGFMYSLMDRLKMSMDQETTLRWKFHTILYIKRSQRFLLFLWRCHSYKTKQHVSIWELPQDGRKMMAYPMALEETHIHPSISFQSLIVRWPSERIFLIFKSKWSRKNKRSKDSKFKQRVHESRVPCICFSKRSLGIPFLTP